MYTIVNNSIATLYLKPNFEAESVSQAVLGTSLEILTEVGDWYQVKMADEYKGWCHRIEFVERKEQYPKHWVTASVCSLWANLYPSRSVKATPLLNAPFNAKLEVETEDENWLELRLPDNTLVYGKKSDFSFNSNHLSTDEMIEQALKFLEIPYLWGGSTPFGFDCSGFVQLLFSLRGIQLPRDAQEQAKLGQTPDELETGDLLFFGDPVDHVGIFLGGDSYIHSSQYGKSAVQISTLTKPPIAKRL